MSQTFMAAEIAEAGAVVRRQLAGNAALTAKLAADLRARKPSFVATIARGSSDHAALYLKHLVELQLGLPCASLGPSIASLYHAPLKLEGAVAIAISQSGRSPDIVAMQRAAKDQRATTVAFVNEEGSPLAQETDALLPLCAGLERSVAATKSRSPRWWPALLLWPIGATTLDSGRRLRLPSVLDHHPPRRLRQRRSRPWPKPRPCSSSVAARRTPSPPRRRSNSRKHRRSTPKPFRPRKCCMGQRGSSGQDFLSSPSRPQTRLVQGSSIRLTASRRSARAAPRRHRTAQTLADIGRA